MAIPPPGYAGGSGLVVAVLVLVGKAIGEGEVGESGGVNKW